MIYTQVSLSREAFTNKLKLETSESTIDRVYRKYKPTSDVLSIPIQATSCNEKGKEVTLKQGKIDMLQKTIKETEKAIAKQIAFIEELSKMLLEIEEKENNNG